MQQPQQMIQPTDDNPARKPVCRCPCIAAVSRTATVNRASNYSRFVTSHEWATMPAETTLRIPDSKDSHFFCKYQFHGPGRFGGMPQAGRRTQGKPDGFHGK